MTGWKLKALESIEASSLGQLPKKEYVILVDTLTDNHQIKSILLGQEVSNGTPVGSKDEPVISAES